MQGKDKQFSFRTQCCTFKAALMARSQVVLFAPLIQTLRDPCEVTAYVQSTIKSRLDKQASLIQDGVLKILFRFLNYQKPERFF